jgi:hypothetical protein
MDMKISGIKPEDINMFHIHCGKPGILGPILVDFSLLTDLKQNFADSLFSVEFGNEALTSTIAHSHGAVGELTTGCIVPSPSLSGLVVQATTISALAYIASQGDLYLNLHTTGQTYYGDIRGQLSLKH